MTQRIFRAVLLCLAVSALTASAFAQGFPKPATTPNTPVPCGLNCARTTNPNLHLWPYQLPISKFVGRFMDSHRTGANFRYPMATLRADGTVFANGRIYVHTGGAVFVYDKNTLVQRLGANEGLATSANIGAPRAGDTPEAFLMPDGFFSAPFAESAAGWIIAKNDFNPSLGAFDIDDQGYVYFGYNEYGFCIARDNDTKGAGLFTPIAQKLEMPVPPRLVTVAKGNGRTYALVGDRVTDTLLAFDVTDRTNPILRGTRRISAAFTAKNTAMDRVAVVDASAALRIYTGDALGEGGNAIATFPGRYSGIASDGTNFYAVSSSSANALVISVIEPNGATYTIKNAFEMPYAPGFTPISQGVLSTAIYADGYLTVVGASGSGGSDLRVFRMGGARPTEVDLGQYVRNHYEVTPPASAVNGVTYTWGNAKSLNPGYNALMSGITFRSGSKDYLLVSARGLGDVYELKGSDSITVALQATPGTANPNAPVSTDLHYGDPVRAIATGSNTTSVATLQWDFGNAEGTKDPNIKTGATGTAVDHRYSGIAKGGTLVRTIKASLASDASISDTRTVTFKTPTARFGVAGIPSSKLQVTSSNASSALPIVVGDMFVDYSDGTVQGHFDAWTIDGVVTKSLPYPASVPVGACAPQHTLNFNAIYGPYSGTGASLLSENGADFSLGISNFVYSVRPFGAAVEVAGSDTNNITFKSVSRFTADTTILSAAQLAAMTYKWELVDKNGAVLAIGPSGTGTAIPNYSVPRLILGAKGIRARLTVASPTPATGSCAGLGFETSAGHSNPLDAPDPVIDGDCTAGGPPCSFTVRSQTLTPAEEVTDGWTYAWSVSPSTVNATVTNQKAFTPTFTAVNTYTLSAVVTNAISSVTAQKTVVVTKAGSNCAPMTDTNIFIAYQGMTTGCTANFSSCSANEDILFAVRPNPVQNYNFSCNPHTYSWTFAGGSSTEASPKKKFPAGTHAVSVVVSNGAETKTYTTNITVGGSSTPPSTPPPSNPPPSNPPSNPPTTPPAGCGTITPNLNIFISWSNASFTCTSTSQGGCATNQDITFNIGQFQLNSGCSIGSVSWNFGDGTLGNTRPITKRYGSTGVFAVNATVFLSGVAYNLSETINIGGVSTPPPSTPPPSTPPPSTPPNPPPSTPPGSCPTLTPNLNVFITWSNGSQTCRPSTQGGCVANEDLNFSIGQFQLNAGCAIQSVAWNFGDNTNSTSRTPTKRYTTGGTYPITATVVVSGTSYTLEESLQIGGTPNPNTPEVTLNFSYSALGNVANGFVFTPTITPATNNGVARWTWDYGDGSTQTVAGAAPLPQSHIYAAAGKYTVVLRALNASGGVVKQTSREITIGAPTRVRAARH